MREVRRYILDEQDWRALPRGGLITFTLSDGQQIEIGMDGPVRAQRNGHAAATPTPEVARARKALGELVPKGKGRRRVLSKELRARVRELLVAKTFTAQAIADAIGCHNSVVYRMGKRP